MPEVGERETDDRTEKEAEALLLLSVAVTVWLLATAAGIVNVPVKLPLALLAAVVMAAVSKRMVIARLAMKPVPVTISWSPTYADALSRVIPGTTVKVALAKLVPEVSARTI
jgi:hypothetical protein